MMSKLTVYFSRTCVRPEKSSTQGSSLLPSLEYTTYVCMFTLPRHLATGTVKGSSDGSYPWGPSHTSVLPGVGTSTSTSFSGEPQESPRMRSPQAEVMDPSENPRRGFGHTPLKTNDFFKCTLSLKGFKSFTRTLPVDELRVSPFYIVPV